MNKEESLGVIGLGLTVLGTLLTLAQRKVANKQLDNRINRVVNEALHSDKRS